jgi:hypothetical protein
VILTVAAGLGVGLLLTAVAATNAAVARQLADRYPGHLVGLIGDAGLPSPDSLVIVVGAA